MNKEDLKFEYLRGQGPGGQHKNKTNSACRVTHIPTGLQAYADEREQGTSRRKALEQLEQRIQDAKAEKLAAERKTRRDAAIKPQGNIRTYNFCRGTVKDHRTGKVAPIKEVMGKGKIELLRGDLPE